MTEPALADQDQLQIEVTHHLALPGNAHLPPMRCVPLSKRRSYRRVKLS
jgi:hypothetical protein